MKKHLFKFLLAYEDTDTVKTFSQEDVDRIVQERLGKEKVRNEKKEAEALKRLESLNLTEQQKQALEGQLEELKLQSATKEEQLAAEIKKRDKKYTEELTTIREQYTSLEGMYRNEKIERELFDAASSNEVYNPRQVVDMFANRTRLVPELSEDGKATGRFRVKTRLKVKKEDGSMTELELSPHEALSKLKEDADYANLFKGKGVSGLGASGPITPQGIDWKTITMDQLRKMKEEGKL